MTYRQTLETLYNMLPDFQNVGAGAYKPGLERVIEFLDILGRPYCRFETIHVAGTNGKGSVSHMLAAILQQQGRRTGLYTSPHLRDFRERMRVDGRMISEAEVMDFAGKHLETMRALGLSFFEATMCMAFDWFSREGVDVAVVEAGLGGRLDSTNVIRPNVSVITNIGLDHQQFLGETLEEIAAEKAGIIKAGVPVVVGEHGEADDVFVKKAAAVGSPLIFAEDVWDGKLIETDLRGDYQTKNIVTLSAVLGVLGVPLPDWRVETGLRGRWEILGRNPLIIADTAHNAHGLRLAMEQLMRTPHRDLYIIIGVVADKDLGSILPLLPREAHYIFTVPSVARALPAGDLADKAAIAGLKGEVVETVPVALERAKELAGEEDVIFVTGSNFVVADLYM